jgi:putative phosphoesterase
MRIGVISDTHGHFDPQVAGVFAGVDHILHAGDVGSLEVLTELRALAPVTAVLGNVDYWEMGLRLTECVELAGRKFLLHHIVNPQHPGDELRSNLAEHQPQVVVFGHSHVPFQRTLGGVLFLNPGYAGKPRFNQPRSVVIAHLDASGLRCESFAL